MRYALFLHEAKAPDAALVGEAFERASELTALDAKRMAAAGDGVLASGLSRDDARAVRRALLERSVGAEVVDEDWLGLPQVRVCRRAAATLGAFVVYDVHGEATRIPWPRVLAMAAGVVRAGREVMVRDMQVSYSSDGTDFEDAEYRYEEHDQLLLEVVTIDPLRRYHVEANQFDYGYLKGRKQPSSGPNLALLVTDIATYGSHVAIGKGAQQLIANAKTTSRHRTVKHFEQTVSWLLWRHHGPGATIVDGTIDVRSEPFGTAPEPDAPTVTKRAREQAADWVMASNETDCERYMQQKRSLDAALSMLVAAVAFLLLNGRLELERFTFEWLAVAAITFAVVTPVAWLALRARRQNKFWVEGDK